MTSFVKVMDFNDRKLAIAFLGDYDTGKLVIGFCQNSIANEILKERIRFDQTEVEQCLISLSKLDIAEYSDDNAFALVDYWAAIFAGILKVHIDERNSKIKSVLNLVQTSSVAALFQESEALFLFIGPVPRVVLLFSRQQGNILLDGLSDQNLLLFMPILEHKLSTSKLPKVSDKVPFICEGCFADFIISALLTIDNGLIIYKQNIKKYPWMENSQNN